MTRLPEPLAAAVAGLARRRAVLLGVDFDGTLAPFVTDPMEARAVPGALDALRSAAALPGVSVAIVSGRDVSTLTQLTGVGVHDPITLIGSHGAEASHAGLAGLAGAQADSSLDPATSDRLAAVTADLEAVARQHPPVRVEHKPAAVALHTRGVDRAIAARASEAAREVATRHTGVHVLPGKDVVELAVVETSKGAALRALASHLDVAATAYIGDDVTDERAFEVLSPDDGDVTVKVGDGPTVARYRVADAAAVLDVLETFVLLRSAADPT